MQTLIDGFRQARPRNKKWFHLAIVPVLVVAGFAIVFSEGSSPASAQAAPIAQCNGDTASNVGGQGIACTVTIVNYVDSTGAPTAPSTISVTVCTGAAGPVGLGAGTCSTTTTTSAEPITLVQQCNGSGNGGGGVVICSVEVINSFSSDPLSAPGPATVYQCVGSVITGPGAPAICTPENTPGVTSVGAATVGQCNGSGNGGTSVGFTCTVSAASTTTSTLEVQVDQCNGSGNEGGSLVLCTASVINQVPPPSTVTATLTTSATPSVTSPGAPSVTASGTPSVTASETPSGTPTGTPTASPTLTAPSGTPTVTVPATGTVTTPTTTGTPAPGTTTTPPAPPSTGNSGPPPQSGSHSPTSLLAMAAVGAALTVLVASRRLSAQRHAPGTKRPE